jgi:hypothetical protein
MSLLSGKKKTNVTEKAVPPVQVEFGITRMMGFRIFNLFVEFSESACGSPSHSRPTAQKDHDSLFHSWPAHVKNEM